MKRILGLIFLCGAQCCSPQCKTLMQKNKEVCQTVPQCGDCFECVSVRQHNITTFRLEMNCNDDLNDAHFKLAETLSISGDMIKKFECLDDFVYVQLNGTFPNVEEQLRLAQAWTVMDYELGPEIGYTPSLRALLDIMNASEPSASPLGISIGHKHFGRAALHLSTRYPWSTNHNEEISIVPVGDGNTAVEYAFRYGNAHFYSDENILMHFRRYEIVAPLVHGTPRGTLKISYGTETVMSVVNVTLFPPTVDDTYTLCITHGIFDENGPSVYTVYDASPLLRLMGSYSVRIAWDFSIGRLAVLLENTNCGLLECPSIMFFQRSDLTAFLPPVGATLKIETLGTLLSDGTEIVMGTPLESSAFELVSAHGCSSAHMAYQTFTLESTPTRNDCEQKCMDDSLCVSIQWNDLCAIQYTVSPNDVSICEECTLFATQSHLETTGDRYSGWCYEKIEQTWQAPPVSISSSSPPPPPTPPFHFCMCKQLENCDCPNHSTQNACNNDNFCIWLPEFWQNGFKLTTYEYLPFPMYTPYAIVAMAIPVLDGSRAADECAAHCDERALCNLFRLTYRKASMCELISGDTLALTSNADYISYKRRTIRIEVPLPIDSTMFVEYDYGRKSARVQSRPMASYSSCIVQPLAVYTLITHVGIEIALHSDIYGIFEEFDLRFIMNDAGDKFLTCKNSVRFSRSACSKSSECIVECESHVYALGMEVCQAVRTDNLKPDEAAHQPDSNFTVALYLNPYVPIVYTVVSGMDAVLPSTIHQITPTSPQEDITGIRVRGKVILQSLHLSSADYCNFDSDTSTFACVASSNHFLLLPGRLLWYEVQECEEFDPNGADFTCPSIGYHAVEFRVHIGDEYLVFNAFEYVPWTRASTLSIRVGDFSKHVALYDLNSNAAAGEVNEFDVHLDTLQFDTIQFESSIAYQLVNVRLDGLVHTPESSSTKLYSLTEKLRSFSDTEECIGFAVESDLRLVEVMRAVQRIIARENNNENTEFVWLHAQILPNTAVWAWTTVMSIFAKYNTEPLYGRYVNFESSNIALYDKRKCLALHTGTGKWHPLECSTPLRAVCSKQTVSYEYFCVTTSGCDSHLGTTSTDVFMEMSSFPKSIGSIYASQDVTLDYTHTGIIPGISGIHDEIHMRMTGFLDNVRNDSEFEITCGGECKVGMYNARIPEHAHGAPNYDLACEATFQRYAIMYILEYELSHAIVNMETQRVSFETPLSDLEEETPCPADHGTKPLDQALREVSVGFDMPTSQLTRIEYRPFRFRYMSSINIEQARNLPEYEDARTYATVELTRLGWTLDSGFVLRLQTVEEFVEQIYTPTSATYCWRRNLDTFVYEKVDAIKRPITTCRSNNHKAGLSHHVYTRVALFMEFFTADTAYAYQNTKPTGYGFLRMYRATARNPQCHIKLCHIGSTLDVETYNSGEYAYQVANLTDACSIRRTYHNRPADRAPCGLLNETRTIWFHLNSNAPNFFLDIRYHGTVADFKFSIRETDPAESHLLDTSQPITLQPFGDMMVTKSNTAYMGPSVMTIPTLRGYFVMYMGSAQTCAYVKLSEEDKTSLYSGAFGVVHRDAFNEACAINSKVQLQNLCESSMTEDMKAIYFVRPYWSKHGCVRLNDIHAANIERQTENWNKRWSAVSNCDTLRQSVGTHLKTQYPSNPAIWSPDQMVDEFMDTMFPTDHRGMLKYGSCYEQCFPEKHLDPVYGNYGDASARRRDISLPQQQTYFRNIDETGLKPAVLSCAHVNADGENVGGLQVCRDTDARGHDYDDFMLTGYEDVWKSKCGSEQECFPPALSPSPPPLKESLSDGEHCVLHTTDTFTDNAQCKSNMCRRVLSSNGLHICCKLSEIQLAYAIGNLGRHVGCTNGDISINTVFDCQNSVNHIGSTYTETFKWKHINAAYIGTFHDQADYAGCNVQIRPCDTNPRPSGCSLDSTWYAAVFFNTYDADTVYSSTGEKAGQICKRILCNNCPAGVNLYVSLLTLYMTTAFGDACPENDGYFHITEVDACVAYAFTNDFTFQGAIDSSFMPFGCIKGFDTSVSFNYNVDQLDVLIPTALGCRKVTCNE